MFKEASVAETQYEREWKSRSEQQAPDHTEASEPTECLWLLL